MQEQLNYLASHTERVQCDWIYDSTFNASYYQQVRRICGGLPYLDKRAEDQALWSELPDPAAALKSLDVVHMMRVLAAIRCRLSIGCREPFAQLEGKRAGNISVGRA